ncbi:RNA exonuclease 1 homolog isoform X2 [Hyla sarda]|uniref:RNA exonuclease 1 homolog isoform X2 n=1 Tax=Hyla sarda TaxID=327740 RepID=UPI0024C28116|nr:RNA exonuclease 1 homolog isoform X2 [Hyla sarda]
MLKNTGYFRAIKCPFIETCLRPHCFFRHSQRGVGSVGNEKVQNGAEYDPYSPEIPVPTCMDEEILNVFPESSQHILELEQVNKAIEEVKSQVEREQRKYEELLETQNPPSKTLSSLEYDPGGSENTASCYNPTPLARSVNPCKYTLDTVERDRSNSRILEYIPTTVTHVSRNKTSKYVIDHSKPYTDLEYDPMVNYSARLLSKNKPQKVKKRFRTNSQDESHAPLYKKLCNRPSKIVVEAENSDSEYNSQSQCSPIKVKDLPSTTKFSSLTISKSPVCATEKRCRTVKETAVQYDIDDIGNSLKSCSKEYIKIPLDPKNEKLECRKEQPIHMHYEQITCINKKQRTESSKSHIKDKSEQVDITNKNSKLEEYKEKKNKRLLEQTENKKIDFESSYSKKLFRQKKGTEKRDCKAKSSKNDMRSKDINNEKQKAKNMKSLSLDKSRIAVQETVNVKTNLKTLSHVDLFGDETSDEEESRKTSKQSNLNSDKAEKSSHRSKVATTRTSVSSVDSSEMDIFFLEKDLDSDSDLDRMEECLRVFNEAHDIKKEDKGRMGKQMSERENKSQESNTLIPGQKRRISHVASANNVDSPSKAAIRPYGRPTPQEICYLRIQKAQEQAAQLLAQQNIDLLSSFAQKSDPMKSIEKMPGSLSSVFCKKNLQLDTVDTCNSSSSTIKLRTLSGMTSKTKSTTKQKRQAHVPSLQCAALKRPVLPTEFGAKVPTTIRQRYLNLFIDECLTSCESQQEAFNKALEEERIVNCRSSNRNIYLNVAVNTLKRLRCKGSETVASPKVVNKKSVSHEFVLGGKLAAKTSFSLKRTIHQDEELTEATIYEKLKKYILTPEQLKEHGYPMVNPEKPGRALVYTEDESKNSESSNKICCRCGAEYLLTPSGNCVRQEECVYHWGRLRRHKVPGGWETQYNCCSGAVGSMGCQVAKQHVQDGRKDNLDGFVKTFEKSNTLEGNPGIFALDCEMCYTTKGLELTRVTVINFQLKVVYDTFVQPDNKIVDYNTRFSGVTEEDLRNTSITLRDVQAVLLCMFSCDSILIGHSLESDLFALKLIHHTVVDTAVVFPHRLGLPYKRALRTLMAEYLKRIIQDSVEGHDSSEDACSCMELMMWRIKEDAKVKR